MHTFARTLLPVVASAAVCFLAFDARGQAAGTAEVNPAEVYRAARSSVIRLAREKSGAEKTTKVLCDKANVADEALLNDADERPKSVQALARSATQARSVCDEQEASEKRLSVELAHARTLLRLLANDLHGCSAAPDSCTATRRGAQVLQMAQSGAGVPAIKFSDLLAAEQGHAEWLALMASSSSAPVAATSKALVLAAATAQKQVTDQKTAVADAYVRGDKAAAAALAASSPGSDPATPARVADARTAFQEADRARDAVRDAQRASNRLVGAALQLLTDCTTKDFEGCDTSTNQPLRQQAWAAQKALANRLAASQQSYQAAKLASYGVDASKYPGAEAARAVRFLRALDDNPDAKSLVGGNDSYKVTAGKGGAGLAIKIVNERAGSDFFRHGSMVISTPSADAGDSTLFKSADGLAKASTLELANIIIKGRGLNSSEKDRPLLHQSGFALKVGYQPTTYVESGALATELKRTLVPWSVSVFSAFSVLLDKDADAKSNARSNASYAKLSWQRQVEEGDTTITCPVAVNDGNFRPQNVVQCSQGPFGAPKLVGAWQLHYEYRVKNEAWPDFSVALKHNVTEKTKKAVTNINVPVYLLKQTDDAKSPIYAGINFGWSSKGGNNFGIFLGAPLSLYSFDR